MSGLVIVVGVKCFHPACKISKVLFKFDSFFLRSKGEGVTAH